MSEAARMSLLSFLRRRSPWILLVAAAILPYIHTLHYGFINYDDSASIVNLPLIRDLSWRSLAGFFVPDIYDGLLEYMPLKNLSYAVDYALFGSSAAAFRPQQIFWYVVSVVAVYAWLRRLFRRLVELRVLELTPNAPEWLAFGTSLLFALHPVHVESVTWLSGRKDVLSGAWMAAALSFGLNYSIRVTQADTTASKLRWPYCVACLACLALALLSKPTALTTAPLLLAQEFWIAPRGLLTPGQRAAQWRGRLSLHVPAWLMTFAFAAFYDRVVAPYARAPNHDASDFEPGFAIRVGQQLARNLQLVLDPSALTPIIPDHRFSADATSVIAIVGYLVLVVLAIVVAAGVRRRHPLALAVVLFVVPLLPSLIRPVWGQYVAGRYLFHAVLGPSFALGWLCAHAIEYHPRLRLLLTAAAGAIVLLWAGGTVAYNSAFRSSDALWEYAIGVDPAFPRFYDLGARAALMRSDPEHAVALLERCLQAVPDASECAAPLGGLLLAFDAPRGEALLERILPRDRTGTAHVRLAQYWSQHGRTRDALELYEHWLQGRGTDPEQLGVLVDLALADQQYVKARAYLRQQIAAASLLRPASPPPSAAIVRAAERAGDAGFATQVRSAANRCNRSDCLADALGVRP